MAGLLGVVGNRAAAWNTLARRQRNISLDRVNEEIERALRMRLDVLELREGVLVGFDVIAVLHFIEAVRGTQIVRTVAVIALRFRRSGDLARVGTGMVIDGQKA